MRWYPRPGRPRFARNTQWERYARRKVVGPTRTKLPGGASDGIERAGCRLSCTSDATRRLAWGLVAVAHDLRREGDGADAVPAADERSRQRHITERADRCDIHGRLRFLLASTWSRHNELELLCESSS